MQNQYLVSGTRLDALHSINANGPLGPKRDGAHREITVGPKWGLQARIRISGRDFPGTCIS